MLRGEILAQVPSLRRYAGCLTGSDEEGDSLVTAMLERIVNGAIGLEGSETLRLALYRALHQVWVPVDVPPRDCRPDAGTSRIDNLLRFLSPMQRAAIILVRLEGFSVGDAAIILRLNEQVVERELGQAERELRHVLARRIMIVEDDALTAMELEQLVMVLGHQPIGPAVTRKEAVDLALREEPDLILSDVCLDDGTSGIEAVREIRHIMNVPVIFLTAFPDHLRDRTILCDSYVIPKPFSDRLVTRFITNALLLHNRPESLGRRMTT